MIELTINEWKELMKRDEEVEGAWKFGTVIKHAININSGLFYFIFGTVSPLCLLTRIIVLNGNYIHISFVSLLAAQTVVLHRQFSGFVVLSTKIADSHFNRCAGD